jgi:predicted transcriptional regulator
MSRMDGNDAALGFEPQVSRSNHVVAPSKRNENLIFSIPSSSDEEYEDEEDIATLRPSPMLRNDVDDDTIDAQHATQEVIGPSPWSPLTASPFTPNVAMDGGKPSRSSSISPRRPGLKLSKVPPSNKPDGSFSAIAMEERCMAPEVVVVPRRRSSPRRSVPSVLEEVVSNQSPPLQSSDRKVTKKKRDAVLMEKEVPVKESILDPIKANTNDSKSVDAVPLKKMKKSADSRDEKVSKKRSVVKDGEAPKPSKKAAKKPVTCPTIETTKESVQLMQAVHKSTEVKPPKKAAKKPTGVIESEPFPSKNQEKNVNNDCKPLSSNQPRTSMGSADPSTHVVSASAASVQDDVSAKSAAAKTKTKKLSFQEQVMLHMLNAFKPFTLKSLGEEMKSNEASINFVLLSLIDKGLVLQKDFSSSKGRVKTLFWANHNGKAKEVSVTVNDRSMDTAERESAQRRMLELRNQIAAVKSQHEQVLQTPSNEDLSLQMEKEELAWQELQQRLQEVKSRIQTNVHVSKERCPVRLKQRVNHLRREWLRRKIMCSEFLEELSFGLEKKMKDVLNLIDIETDEMHGAVMPAVYKVP